MGRRAALLAVCAVAVLLAGCRVEQPVPVILSGTQISLPLDRFLLAPADVERIDVAYRALLSACARRFGVDTPDGGGPQPAPRTIGERRYGLADPAVAATAGYHLDRAGPPGKVSEAGPLLPEVLNGNGRAVIGGLRVPDGGCVGEAQRRLGPVPTGTDMQLAQNLAAESFARSKQDTRVVRVTRDWSQCMREHGFDYRGPLDAATDGRFRGDQPTPAEITTASADVACKQQTNLLGVWMTVESGYQRALITANRPALEAVRAVNQTRLAAVRR